MKTRSSLLSSVVVLTLVSMVVASCDTPRNNGGRAKSLTNSLTGSSSNNYSTLGTSDNGTTTSSSGGSSTATSGVGFSSCSLGTYTTKGDVSMAVCQSTVDETKIRVKFQLDYGSTLGDRTCFVPTYRDGSGGSVYIGNASCTTHIAGQQIDGTLTKSRAGFSSYPIKGVMVMKQASLDYYIACMDAVALYGSSGQLTCAGLSNGLAVGAVNVQCLCYYFKTYKNYIDVAF